MNSLLRNSFRHAIKMKSETAFQEFVAFLFAAAHGAAFTTLKQKRDKGSDGILNGNTILAVYGPESYSLSGFKKKIGDDYTNYSTNWKSSHPLWMVVFNGDFLANMVQFVEMKHAGTVKMGLSELVEMIERLSWTNIRRIGEYLGIPTELLLNDLIGEVVDDLVKAGESGNVTSDRPNAVYIEDKIALNFERSEVPKATDDYYECLTYFDATEKMLRERSAMEVSALRQRIRRDFDTLSGGFKQRFQGLLDRYCEAHPADDLYRFAVTVLLTFFFEHCLIGTKSPKEA